ncbi:MAG: hypothetical protein AAF899_00305 [Pseudomonadota bacterium]
MLRPLIRFALSLTVIGAALVGFLIWDGRLGIETSLFWRPGPSGGSEGAAADTTPTGDPLAGGAPEDPPASTPVSAPAATGQPSEVATGSLSGAGSAEVATTEPDDGADAVADGALAALSPPEETPASPPDAPVEQGPSGVEGQEDRPPPATSDAPTDGAALDPAGDAGAVPQDAGADPGAVETADPDAPVFDIVRVAPDGSAVIAGRSRPGETVELLRDGEPIAEVVADARGNFAIIAEVGIIDAPLALQLRADRAVEGGEPGQLAVVEVRPGGAVAGVTPRRAGDEDAFGTGVIAEPVPVTGSLGAPLLLLPAEEAGQAPRVIETAPDSVALADPGSGPVGAMVLDSVSYDPGGAAIARGRSPARSVVRVFVNNAMVTETRVADDGSWEATVPRLAAATAEILRFEQIDEAGNIRRRLETRFDYAPGDGPLSVQERTIVVERGDSLWLIAEDLYGEGLRYSVIFGANESLIVDPDLIYPEQVFIVPDLVPGEGPIDDSPVPEGRPLGGATPTQ